MEFIQIQQINLYYKLPRTEAILTNMTGPPITGESCSCPQGRIGFSCEQCAEGHYRTSGNPADPCLPCQCNGLAQTCDQRTGVCINCTGNSEGDHCELCVPGYFGNTTTGVPCLPCQCPLPNKSFSPTCILDNDMQQTCDNCTVGYAGRRCELCANGYFGNPLVSLRPF